MLIRLSKKKMHFHKYFEEPDITNAEKTWQGISELIN